MNPCKYLHILPIRLSIYDKNVKINVQPILIVPTIQYKLHDFFLIHLNIIFMKYVPFLLNESFRGFLKNLNPIQSNRPNISADYSL